MAQTKRVIFSAQGTWDETQYVLDCAVETGHRYRWLLICGSGENAERDIWLVEVME